MRSPVSGPGRIDDVNVTVASPGSSSDSDVIATVIRGDGDNADIFCVRAAGVLPAGSAVGRNEYVSGQANFAGYSGHEIGIVRCRNYVPRRQNGANAGQVTAEVIPGSAPVERLIYSAVGNIDGIEGSSVIANGEVVNF